MLTYDELLSNYVFLHSLFLKSARLSKHVYITWNFDLQNDVDYPDPIYVHLPVMLRVEVMILDTTENFVKCTCGGRKGVGVHCECYFPVADNAKL